MISLAVLRSSACLDFSIALVFSLLYDCCAIHLVPKRFSIIGKQVSENALDTISSVCISHRGLDPIGMKSSSIIDHGQMGKIGANADGRI
jgi:hypothetical protein